MHSSQLTLACEKKQSPWTDDWFRRTIPTQGSEGYYGIVSIPHTQDCCNSMSRNCGFCKLRRDSFHAEKAQNLQCTSAISTHTQAGRKLSCVRKKYAYHKVFLLINMYLKKIIKGLLELRQIFVVFPDTMTVLYTHIVPDTLVLLFGNISEQICKEVNRMSILSKASPWLKGKCQSFSNTVPSDLEICLVTAGK